MYHRLTQQGKQRLTSIVAGMCWLMVSIWAAAGAPRDLRASQDDLSAAGDNSGGNLGIGVDAWEPAPALISGVLTAAGSAVHTVVLRSDGTVWAWGRNNAGELGDGTSTDRSVPGRVPGLTSVIAVAAGAGHTLALKSDGTVWAWGWNSYGQLGDGTTAVRRTPVQVSELTSVIAVAAGSWHSLAVRADGTVWAWGCNETGQLGDGTWSNRTTPAQVSGLAGVTAIAGGESHTLALKNNGTVWACGGKDSRINKLNASAIFCR